MPEFRPPAIPSITPMAALFPEVHLAPGQQHDPNEYDLQQRIKAAHTQGAWFPSVETHRDADGRFVHEGCPEGFSCVEPFELMFPRLRGRTFYGNPVYDRIEETLTALQSVIARDANTKGTLILPRRPWEPWWAKFVAARKPIVRIVAEYDAAPSHGRPPTLFDYKDDRGRRRGAGDIVETILVVRVAHPQVLRELCDPQPQPGATESVTLPAQIGQSMLEDLRLRAAGMSLAEAEAANPAEALQDWHAAFVSSPDDIARARDDEHSDVISAESLAEACREAFGVLEPIVRRLWGSSRR